MTHDDDIRNLVRRAGDVLPVSPAPVQSLLQQGRGAHRRRTVTTIGVVAASVAVITSGAVAVGSHVTNDATNQPAASTTSPNTSLIPPPGMRYVGRNGIAVAISDSMVPAPSGLATSAQIRWHIPTNPSTRNDFPRDNGPDLSIGPIAVSSIEFYAPHAYSTGKINGATVQRYGPYPGCAWADCSIAPPYFAGAIWSRDADVFIWVTASSRSQVAAILDSVTAIPSTSVAIPNHPTASELSQLGLAVRRIYPYCVREGPGADGTRPAAGSVVPRGSTVTAAFC